MKKIVAVITLIMYISLSAVQAISLHFCHGELESLYFTKEKTSCCAGTHANHSKCCKDVTIEIDFDNDHLVSETISIQNISYASSIYGSLLILSNEYSLEDIQPEVYCSAKLPPPKIYLVQHSFLFYG